MKRSTTPGRSARPDFFSFVRKNNIKLGLVEYEINGYGNVKSRVNIKQSKYHILIEPNNNGFDK